MRLYTPLDLRNIKDIYTRAAFRRLDQWLRDLAGNLSPSQDGSAANQIVEIQQILNTPPVVTPVRFDDFTRFVNVGVVESTESFDGIPWTLAGGATANTIRDTRAAADTTYPDTGLWVINPALDAAGQFVLSAALANAASFFPFMRDSVQWDFWIGQPTGSTMTGMWGMVQPGAGNFVDPDHCIRFLEWRHPTTAYDTLHITAAYSGVSAPSTDFIALHYRHPTGPVNQVIRIGKASDFQALTATKPVKCSLLFKRNSTTGRYDVTATIPGFGHQTATDVNGQGYLHMGTQQDGASVPNGKLYLDAFLASRTLPT